VTERITRAPASGIWKMPDAGAIRFDRRVTDWHTVADESEAFYLRIAAEGSTATRARTRDPGHAWRFMDDEHELLDRTKHGSGGSSPVRELGAGDEPAVGPSRSLQAALGAMLDGAMTPENICARCACCRSRSVPSRSSSSVRGGRRSSREVAALPRVVPPRRRGRGPRTPRACGCSVSTCPSCSPPTSASSSSRRERPRRADAVLVHAAAYLAACSQARGRGPAARCSRGTTTTRRRGSRGSSGRRRLSSDG
jgi:hypothetical protein